MENQHQVAVVMVPFLFQSHLIANLRLSRLISAYKIPVYFVGTTAHVSEVKSRVEDCDPSISRYLHFHDIPLNLNLSGNKLSDSISMVLATIPHFEKPVLDLVTKLGKEFRRVVVIFDSMMANTVQCVNHIPNAESYCLNLLTAASLVSFWWEMDEELSLLEKTAILKEAPSLQECVPPEFKELALTLRPAWNAHSGNIFNTNRVIEGFYIDLVAKNSLVRADKNWAIGPFNPVRLPDVKNGSKIRHRCLEWLDKQPVNSVIYVSFGSLCSLPVEQARELALGLESSGQKFIWVLRDAEKGDHLPAGETTRFGLPDGYEDRVKERGIIVRDWSPQLEILSHASTGGFMTHCGSSSVMESISMGVPMATWPLVTDGPTNALLITKELKIGVEVIDWARQRGDLVSSAMVETAVRRLMASEEGDEIRKRAEEMGDDVKKSVMEGGATRLERDSFIHHITR